MDAYLKSLSDPCRYAEILTLENRTCKANGERGFLLKCKNLALICDESPYIFQNEATVCGLIVDLVRTPFGIFSILALIFLSSCK